MSDDFIHQFDAPKPPRPEFAAALYQRIAQPVKTTPRTRVLRAAALCVAMVAVIATVLFFSPSVRALADSIVHKKGNMTFQTVNDAAAASQLAGFTVLVPSYLPDGYTADNQPGVWTVSDGPDGVMADTTYSSQAANGQIAIVEQKVRPGQTNPVLNSSEVQHVTVRSKLGKWLWNNGHKSILGWDENGVTYIIVTNNVPKDEVLKVAASLGK